MAKAEVVKVSELVPVSVLPTALPTIQKSMLRSYEPGTCSLQGRRKEDAQTKQGTPSAQAALAIKTPVA